jgi:hypothetical protein
MDHQKTSLKLELRRELKSQLIDLLLLSFGNTATKQIDTDSQELLLKSIAIHNP